MKVQDLLFGFRGRFSARSQDCFNTSRQFTHLDNFIPTYDLNFSEKFLILLRIRPDSAFFGIYGLILLIFFYILKQVCIVQHNFKKNIINNPVCGEVFQRSAHHPTDSVVIFDDKNCTRCHELPSIFCCQYIARRLQIESLFCA